MIASIENTHGGLGTHGITTHLDFSADAARESPARCIPAISHTMGDSDQGAQPVVRTPIDHCEPANPRMRP